MFGMIHFIQHLMILQKLFTPTKNNHASLKFATHHLYMGCGMIFRPSLWSICYPKAITQAIVEQLF